MMAPIWVGNGVAMGTQWGPMRDRKGEYKIRCKLMEHLGFVLQWGRNGLKGKGASADE